MEEGTLDCCAAALWSITVLEANLQVEDLVADEREGGRAGTGVRGGNGE